MKQYSFKSNLNGNEIRFTEKESERSKDTFQQLLPRTRGKKTRYFMFVTFR